MRHLVRLRQLSVQKAQMSDRRTQGETGDTYKILMRIAERKTRLARHRPRRKDTIKMHVK